MKRTEMPKLGLGLRLLGTGLLALYFTGVFAHSDNPDTSHKSDGIEKVKLENLMKMPLARVDGTEVIVSRVSLPPHTRLPKHWHPGEEFAYIIDGSVVLWQDGKEEIIGKTGDAMQIPLKQIHTAMTRDSGAVILVFRVHESGQPERVLVK